MRVSFVTSVHERTSHSLALASLTVSDGSRLASSFLACSRNSLLSILPAALLIQNNQFRPQKIQSNKPHLLGMTSITTTPVFMEDKLQIYSGLQRKQVNTSSQELVSRYLAFDPFLYVLLESLFIFHAVHLCRDHVCSKS